MIGVLLLVVVGILIFLGMAHQVLDRLYLSDRGGLIFIGALVVGSFIDIPVWSNPKVTLNIGGALLPLGLAIYVLIKAGSAKEWLRSLIGIVVTVGVLYGVSRLYRFDTKSGIIEPQYLWAILSAVIAYVVGRSRRLAFIIATVGLIAMDVVRFFEVIGLGISAPVLIGGAGAFDTIVVASILAVLLAEIIGEGREALQGGPVREERPAELREALDHPEGTGKEEEK
ncbi:putative membrane protein [Hydrogenispora ethanolica]|jgi:uncharacterized membrane protein|uniref:Putative membrane protein n=1 Tax=Hydrogenispora ethanolica TaxID=1082276 RepID=A0A4R1RSA2_HYDET|nr:DUF1614 domain-containing protein [Hydrogenispora ethanolica]TCL69343.1 putative membrane protein [Hydrogenispora ethanolica]